MKKKLLTLFMALVLVLSNSMVTFAEGTDASLEDRYKLIESELGKAVTGKEAVAAIGNDDVLILDVRNDAKRSEVGNLGDAAYHLPVFKADGTPVATATEDLAKAFVADVANNLTTIFNVKDIYVLCNGGARGARAASVLLGDAGVPLANIHTITGGAGDADMQQAFRQYVTGEETLSKLTDSNVLIVDVRTKTNYDLGHLPASLSYPLFGSSGVDQTLVANFTQYVKDNMSKFEGKDIYILCNSGASGALNGTTALRNAGIPMTKIFTITGGASNNPDKGSDGAINPTTLKPTISSYQFVTADQAIKNESNAFIIDVRNTTNFAFSNLDGSVNWPLFVGSNVTTGSDSLAKEFLVNANSKKETLKDTPIYILCNSGARGAQAATQLLADAGYDTANLYTIEGGATTLELRYAMLEENKPFPEGSDALAAVEAGTGVILDVRNNANYDAGHIKNSVHIPIFGEDGKPATTTKDQLATDFVTAVTDNKSLAGKDIYVLCNSGQRGARAAIALLKDAEYAEEDLFTINGGATKGDLTAADFIKSLPAISEYNFIAGADAAGFNKDVDPSKAFIIDVRTTDNFAKGSLKDAVNWPLFDANGVTNGEDALADAFVENVKKAEIGDKPIYILCNSGQRGAQFATRLLVNEGFNQKQIFTITNGAKGLDVRYAMLGENPTTPVTSEQALAAIGNDNIVILDVRAAGNFAKGHLKGAVSAPLFNSNGVVPTADTKDAATNAHQALVAKFLEDAKDLAGKEIYVLCNSGQSGARAATVLLHKEAGIPLDKIHTITGGYNKNEDIQAAAIYITPERAINAAETPETDKLIIDVRAAELYAAGHLKGSVSLPLFNSNKELPDDLAEAFVAAVKANKEAFEGKTVYILCNSGSRGAVKATELLAGLGITNVFTIEGGAGTETIKPYLTSTEPTTLEDIIERDNASNSGEGEGESESTGTVKTGDSTNIMPYTLTMAFALLAIVLVSKKKFTK